jgi:hypothetical protein
MKQTIGFTQFVDAFRAHDRFEQFGFVALRALFDYLEELEQDIGVELELDVIALCCEWSAYPSATAACADLAAAGEPVEPDEEDAEQQCLEWLEYQTNVVPFNGGILVMAF